MLQRTLPAGFIAPCLPTKTDKLHRRHLMSIKYHFRNTRLQIVERRFVVIIM